MNKGQILSRASRPSFVIFHHICSLTGMVLWHLVRRQEGRIPPGLKVFQVAHIAFLPFI